MAGGRMRDGTGMPREVSLCSSALRVECNARMVRRPPQGQRSRSVPKVRWWRVAQSRRRFVFFFGGTFARGPEMVGASGFWVARGRSEALGAKTRAALS